MFPNVSTTFFKKFAAIALSLLFTQPGFAAASENEQMVFEGNLTDTSGNAISLASVQLNFYITANGCYLYGESSLTSGDSQGNILHRFGSGSVIAGSPNTFSQNLFFGNVTGTTTFAGNNCSVTAADTRLAQVYYPAQNITATIKLGTVPYAQNATTLSGKAVTDFVQTSVDTVTLFTGGSAGQILTKSASGLTWTTSNITAAQVTSALGYTPSSATLTASAINTALGYTPASNTALAAYALTSSLGSLASKNFVNLGSADASGTLSAARLPSFSGDVVIAAGSSTTSVQSLRGVALSATAPASGQVLFYNGSSWTPITPPNPGIGTVTNISAGTGLTGGSITSAGTLSVNFGTSAGTVMQGNDSRVTGALQAANNLSDVVSATLARNNLGLGSLATANSVDLGSTNATGILAPARLPAFTGDASNAVGSSTLTVSRLRGINISTSAPTTSQVLAFDGTQWSPTNMAPSGVTTIFTGTGLLGGPISSSGTISINFGASAGTVAAGNDIRIVQALQSVNNLSDVTSASLARSNLGLGSLATKSSVNLATEVSGVLPLANGGTQWNTSGTTINYMTGNIGIGTTNPAARLTVSGGIRFSMDVNACSASYAGTIRYNSGNVEYCNGTTWSALEAAGASIVALNGSTSATQTFATNTTGLSPVFSTANGIHTLNIPMALTASATAGLISNADYSAFTNKITSSSASIAAVLGYTPANSATVLLKANNLSDLSSTATARSNLGLGSFATANTIDLGSASATGTLAIARIPAFTGDALIAAGSSTITVTKLRGIDISAGMPVTGNVLTYNGTQWTPSPPTLGTVTNVNAGTGLLGGSITSSGTLSVNFGASAGTVAQGNDTRIVQALQSVNNLSDVTSATVARNNLGLGSLATKATAILNTTDVSGILPIANGGSKWSTHANGIYTVSNTVIGSTTVLTNTKFLVEGNTPSQVSRFINTSTTGYGVRIDVAGSSAAQYALNVNNASGSVFMVQNDGYVGINNISPVARLHVREPTSTEMARFDGTTGGSFIALYGNGTQKGFVGYGSGGTLFANELANSVGIRSEGNLQLGIGSNAQVTVTSAGTVGIGTTAPASKLQVAGAVTSKPQTVAGTVVDLSLSNMFILNSVGGSANSAISITLNNLVDGGTYTLIVTDTVAHTYSFSGCVNSYFSPANSLTVPATRTIFGLITLKNGANWDCYINWTPGYQ